MYKVKIIYKQRDIEGKLKHVAYSESYREALKMAEFYNVHFLVFDVNIKWGY